MHSRWHSWYGLAKRARPIAGAMAYAAQRCCAKVSPRSLQTAGWNTMHFLLNHPIVLLLVTFLFLWLSTRLGAALQRWPGSAG